MYTAKVKEFSDKVNGGAEVKVMGTDKHGSMIKMIPGPKGSTQERLSAEWEALKPVLPDGELRQFIARCITRCIEEWRGGESPKPRLLTVELVKEVEPHDCEFTETGEKCVYCGKSKAKAWKELMDKKDKEKWDDQYKIPSGPISPYAGFNF